MCTQQQLGTLHSRVVWQELQTDDFENHAVCTWNYNHLFGSVTCLRMRIGSFGAVQILRKDSTSNVCLVSST